MPEANCPVQIRTMPFKERSYVKLQVSVAFLLGLVVVQQWTTQKACFLDWNVGMFRSEQKPQTLVALQTMSACRQSFSLACANQCGKVLVSQKTEYLPGFEMQLPGPSASVFIPSQEMRCLRHKKIIKFRSRNLYFLYALPQLPRQDVPAVPDELVAEVFAGQDHPLLEADGLQQLAQELVRQRVALRVDDLSVEKWNKECGVNS